MNCKQINTSSKHKGTQCKAKAVIDGYCLPHYNVATGGGARTKHMKQRNVQWQKTKRRTLSKKDYE